MKLNTIIPIAVFVLLSLISFTLMLLHESNVQIKRQLIECQQNLFTFKNLDEKNISDIKTYIEKNYKRVPPVVSEEISVRTVELASKYGIAIPILVGMMEVESNFRPHALSKKYARGLMQVRWKVWETVLKEELNMKDHFELHQVKSGIEAGVIVFKYYLSENNNDISTALYDYVGKDKNYASKVYEAMGKFVLHRASTMSQMEKPHGINGEAALK